MPTTKQNKTRRKYFNVLSFKGNLNRNTTIQYYTGEVVTAIKKKQVLII